VIVSLLFHEVAERVIIPLIYVFQALVYTFCKALSCWKSLQPDQKLLWAFGFLYQGGLLSRKKKKAHSGAESTRRSPTEKRSPQELTFRKKPVFFFSFFRKTAYLKETK
jgi:hypothetical protein